MCQQAKDKLSHLDIEVAGVQLKTVTKSAHRSNKLNADRRYTVDSIVYGVILSQPVHASRLVRVPVVVNQCAIRPVLVVVDIKMSLSPALDTGGNM